MTVSKKPKCVHCGRPNVSRPRGMCWTCYYLPGVRDQYATKGNAGHGVGQDNHAHRLAAIPTRHLPGTEGKLREMAARVAAGVSCFHPGDRLDGDRVLSECTAEFRKRLESLARQSKGVE